MKGKVSETIWNLLAVVGIFTVIELWRRFCEFVKNSDAGPIIDMILCIILGGGFIAFWIFWIYCLVKEAIQYFKGKKSKS